MQRVRNYGCDAVEVDCLGIYHYRKEYTKEDSYMFAKWVAETAHSVGISIGLKNVAEISSRLEPYFDFAVVENFAESQNVCDYYTQFTKNNKAVLIVHYGDRGFNLSSSSALSKLIRELKGRIFTCVIQNLYHKSVNFNCDTGSVIGKSNYK